MSTTIVTHWYFHCPECGFGDEEVGQHAASDMIWCEICLEEKRHVRLRRWPAEPDASGSASGALSGGGAADSGFPDALLRRRSFGRRR